MQVEIIGVPMDLGAEHRGVDMGPSAIRHAHLHRKLSELGHTIHDRGNLAVPIAETCRVSDPNLKYIDCIVPLMRRVAGAVATSIRGGNFPLVLGGDHSIALGSIRGAARNRRLGLIWVDAHADFNTPDTTPSGNIHGMPLAALCGLGDPRLVRLWKNEAASVLDPERVTVIGVRNLDPGEKKNLRDAGVTVMDIEQIDRLGMYQVMGKALSIASLETDGLYLSFDVDCLDPQHAPGVGTPVPGGLTYREAHLTCEMVAETGKLVGMDIVEVNPILDVQNQTAAVAVDLIISALGRRVWER